MPGLLSLIGPLESNIICEGNCLSRRSEGRFICLNLPASSIVLSDDVMLKAKTQNGGGGLCSNLPGHFEKKSIRQPLFSQQQNT